MGEYIGAAVGAVVVGVISYTVGYYVGVSKGVADAISSDDFESFAHFMDDIMSEACDENIDISDNDIREVNVA